MLKDRAGSSERKIVLFARIVILLGVLIGVAAPAQADRRIALVVGNNAYETVARLERAVGDAGRAQSHCALMPASRMTRP